MGSNIYYIEEPQAIEASDVWIINTTTAYILNIEDLHSTETGIRDDEKMTRFWYKPPPLQHSTKIILYIPRNNKTLTPNNPSHKIYHFLSYSNLNDLKAEC